MKYKKLVLSELKNKQHKTISSEEALKDVEPFDWDDEGLSGDRKVTMYKNTDIVFSCKKCGHSLFVSDINFKKLEEIIERPCDMCGRDGETWILLRTGNYEEEYCDE